jgi:tetratricopeptide (TPR) repeat protein
MSDPEPDDLDARIDALHEQAGEYLEASLFRSAYRLYGELKRLGKSEQRVIPYINAVFHQMDLAQSLLEPRVTRDNAVELIALLEDEERARLLQPDFPAAHYEAEAAWMTACAYENLAEATGMLEGYNSAGMHQCITDGLEVCRRTGKLACVGCFREYAAQVYTAADDLDLALHSARLIAANLGPYPDRGDRRHLGARNEAWLMLLRGQLDAAAASLERSLALCDGPHVAIPLSSRLHSLIELEAVRLLAGTQDPAQTTATLAAAAGDGGDGKAGSRLPSGERPDLELRWAYADAVRACVRGDFEQAIALLTDWDRRLSERHCLHDWFETRLRLLAAHRLAGRAGKAEALARPLEQRARKADDWLTVRRLARLLDPDEAPSPLALLAPLPSGPFAGAAPKATVTAPAAPETQATPPSPAPQDAASPEQEAPPATPLQDWFNELVGRLEAAADDDARAGIRDDLLAVPPDQVTDPLDACRLLNLVRFLVGDGARGEEIWAWAEAVAGRFVQHAPALSLLGALGDVLRNTGEAMAAALPKGRVEQLLRQALDLDPDDAGNFARAGAYFLGEGNFGEAERCLARGFRLQRDSGFLASRLAEVYNETERPRDALAVLDLCLREGCDEPPLAWDAALAAFRLEQFDVMLTYLDRFEEMTEADAWACYYRATALLELGRPEEANAALDQAERRDPAKLFPVNILRACAAAALGRPQRYRELLEGTLAVRLAGIDYLTITGLNNLFGRLWKASACLPADDPLRAELRTLLLQAGLAPDALFEEERAKCAERAGINYYRCLVRQPLDARWPESRGCLAEQADWTAYHIVWGVLAADEDEAARAVLAWQARCYPRPAEVEETEPEDEGYTDRPGVVWQGARWGDTPDEGTPAAGAEG